MEKKSRKDPGKKVPNGILKKRRFWILSAAVALVLALTAGTVFFLLTGKNQEKQQEAAIARNDRQSVSDTVTEEGSVSVGTVSQTFELDLSEYTGQSDFSWNSIGSMAAGPGMMEGGGQSGIQSLVVTTSSGNRQLTVEEVYVKVGEEVKAGDPILKVTADTLSEIRQGFAEDVTDAKEVYDQMVTQQMQTQKEASVQLQENELYGSYADTEYNLAVAKLEEAVEELQESLQNAQEMMEKDQEDLAGLQETLEEQQAVLENAVYTVENEDRSSNAYGWLLAVNAKVDEETIIESLETQIESLEESIALQEEEIESLSMQLTNAQKELESGKIEAESARQIRIINGNSAQEIYDVTTQLADFEAQNAKEDYDEAAAKLEELDTYIVDQVICAAQDGVITAVSVSAGDALQEGTELIALNSYDDVTITLTLDEDEMDMAGLGSKAEVVFSAFPDEVFTGEVTEIGDAQIDSNTNMTTYEVVVSILENGSRLYEGMTAEVTFTRQQKGEPE
ncbi:MAG: efflux RND transporter periplasmic adaptor subunit [Eubacteriales bacterium]|nr:efflux RND transporter periplasmic adaptor subunit [Eubacteriales bacterium]